MAKVRSSNMELLRLFAMLLVMLVHTAFLAFGVPTTEECHTDAAGAFRVFLTESFSVVCVNVFVLLSGWFGIKFDLRKIAGLFFQTFFFAAIVLAAVAILVPDRFLHLHNLTTLLMLNESDYWFIKAYIGLCFLAPFLNTFIEKSNEKELRRMLIAFYTFQTIYGWLSIDGAGWLGGGYSAVSFIGLYLLARYVRLYGQRWIGQKWQCHLSVYIGIAIAQLIVAFCVTYAGFPIAGRLFTYTNPLVILQSLALLLFFNKLSFQSHIINWMASSCVAVYLLHANELVLRNYYGPTAKNISDTLEWPLSFFGIAAFIAVIFISAILLDKVRMMIWRLITRQH